jgi:Trm5-related predicted tRNA methylase
MSVQTSPAKSPVSPAQVWARLANELQKRTIRLMAQLALNLVATQSGWLVAEDEVSDHVSTSNHPQNPA